jgi:hypothetical protein
MPILAHHSHIRASSLTGGPMYGYRPFKGGNTRRIVIRKKNGVKYTLPTRSKAHKECSQHENPEECVKKRKTRKTTMDTWIIPEPMEMKIDTRQLLL